MSKPSQPNSVGLLSLDLKLSAQTVRRHVDTLVTAGRLCRGHDGEQLELTDSERREREVDARVATHR